MARELKPVLYAWRRVTQLYRRPTWHQFWECVLAQCVASPPPAIRHLMYQQAMHLYVSVYGLYSTPGHEDDAHTARGPRSPYPPTKETA